MRGCRRDGDDLILTLRIQPKASRDEVCGEHGEAIRIRITAPPVEGRANTHLIGFLAKLFKVPKGRVSLISGEGGRDKVVRVQSPRELPGWCVDR